MTAFTKNFHITLLVFFSVLLVTACSAVNIERLSNDDFADIRKKNKSIVLYRVRAIEDGAWVDASDASWDASNVNVWAVPSRKKPVQNWINWREFSPSPETKKDGWRYLLLEPGVYRLRFASRYSFQWRPKDTYNGGPSFSLVVPQKSSVLYAGSFTLTCSKDWEGTGAACARDLKPKFEKEAAATIANAQFANLGKLQAAHIRSFGLPVNLQDFGTILANARDVSAIVTPDWKKRAGEAAFGWAEPFGRSGEGLALLLLYAPMGIAIASELTKQAERKWGPCAKNIVEDYRSLVPANLIEESARKRIEKLNLPEKILWSDKNFRWPKKDANQTGKRALLQLAVVQAFLRECKKRNRFCLEFAVRARLTDLKTSTDIYDTVFTYTNRSRRFRDNEQPFLRHEYVIQTESQCRKFNEFCEPENGKSFKAELQTAIDKITDAIFLTAKSDANEPKRDPPGTTTDRADQETPPRTGGAQN
jgi:hypothetical protein